MIAIIRQWYEEMKNGEADFSGFLSLFDDKSAAWQRQNIGQVVQWIEDDSLAVIALAESGQFEDFNQAMVEKILPLFESMNRAWTLGLFAENIFQQALKRRIEIAEYHIKDRLLSIISNPLCHGRVRRLVTNTLNGMLGTMSRTSLHPLMFCNLYSDQMERDLKANGYNPVSIVHDALKCRYWAAPIRHVDTQAFDNLAAQTIERFCNIDVEQKKVNGKAQEGGKVFDERYMRNERMPDVRDDDWTSIKNTIKAIFKTATSHPKINQSAATIMAGALHLGLFRVVRELFDDKVMLQETIDQSCKMILHEGLADMTLLRTAMMASAEDHERTKSDFTMLTHLLYQHSGKTASKNTSADDNDKPSKLVKAWIAHASLDPEGSVLRKMLRSGLPLALNGKAPNLDFLQAFNSMAKKKSGATILKNLGEPFIIMAPYFSKEAMGSTIDRINRIPLWVHPGIWKAWVIAVTPLARKKVLEARWGTSGLRNTPHSL